MSEITSTTPALESVRYRKPKIFLVDLPDRLTKSLRALGYNARPGTFGRPYKVEQSDGFVPVLVKVSVPNYTEQEIIVIDLTPPETAAGPEAEKLTSPGELDWYAKASTGVIDPRPYVMTRLRKPSDRILEAGGCFVIFAEEREGPKLLLAAIDIFSTLATKQTIEEDNWSILSILSRDHLQVKSDYGTEIKVSEGLGLFSSFLRRHLEGATFRATLHPKFPLSEDSNGPIFFPLATSKFNETVAGVIWPREKGQGFVLILPQLDDKERALVDLIQTVLPEISRQLFPDHEGGRWVHREEYDHPAILKHQAAQLEVQQKANEEIAGLDKEIEAERERLAFLHGILTKSGKPLVTDVKSALEFIDFDQVVNVDEAVDDEANKQEDLQVLDKVPPLLLEIKGLAGMPTEGDTLQVTKYVLRRMKQWNQTDVIGLSLVNHQRNLPAMERDHKNAFTPQQVQDAEQNVTGLMTTWDLFRLIRGMMEWQWPSQAVRDVLYGRGRLGQHPSHYTILGTVAHYWTEISVIGIDVTGDVLRLGDRVGYLLEDGFFEEEVTSLEVDNKPVKEVPPDNSAGMKTKLTRREVPVGTQVFRVGNF
jgi:hypothetical protein